MLMRHQMISVIERIDTEQITKLDFFHRQIKCLRGLFHKINIYVLSSFGMSSFTIVFVGLYHNYLLKCAHKMADVKYN